MAVAAYILSLLGAASIGPGAATYVLVSNSTRQMLNMLSIIALGLAACGVLGFLLAIISIVRMLRYPPPRLGMNYAIAAIIILSMCGLLMLSTDPIFSTRTGDDYRNEGIVCMTNLKELNLAALAYAQDHDGKFPPETSWNKAIHSYSKTWQIFYCPHSREHVRPSYAMNRGLTGLKLPAIRNPEETVLFFESTPECNVVGGPELIASPPRHDGGNNYSFVDGHVKWLRQTGTNRLRWRPKL